MVYSFSAKHVRVHCKYMFNATRRKVVGHTVETIRDEYLDFDDDMLPPVGATLRVVYDVFATETD